MYEPAVLSSSDAFSFYQNGLDVIRAVQSFASPVLTSMMKLITGLVSEGVFFALILLLFWLVNERKAFRLGLLVILTAWLNIVLKARFAEFRPFYLDPAVGLIRESGYSFPSGHAQLITVFAAALAIWYRKAGAALVRAGAVLVILLVSFSRVYLGVHYPWDILGGWLFAGVSLGLFFPVCALLERRGFPRAFRTRLLCAAAVPLAMNALHSQDRLPAALFLGFAAGYAVMRRYFPFSARPSGAPDGRLKPAAAAPRLFAGFAGAAVLYAGLKAMFPGADSSLYGLFRFIRYATLGFWASGGAPWCFIALERALKRRRKHSPKTGGSD